MPANARRVQLTIAGTAVSEALMDFPVYVDLTQNDFKAKLNPTQLSFKRRVAGAIENLPYEVQSYEAATGRLRAWVLLPQLSNAAENVFELQYGDTSVAAAPNPPEVWRNHYKIVYHLETASGPIPDSRGLAPATPASLKRDASTTGKLGKGVEFDNNRNGVVTFTNPILGSGPSTISVWLKQGTPDGKETLVVLGTSMLAQARWLYSEFDNDQAAVGLTGDDWLNTGEDLDGSDWTLLHWTYNNKVSYLYRDAELVGDAAHTHANAANTTGTVGTLGNARGAGFDNDAGLRGILDEVRISDVQRTSGWIAAEFANQSDPTSFVTASQPQMLP